MNAFLTYLWFLSGTVGCLIIFVLVISMSMVLLYFLIATIECDGLGWINGTEEGGYYEKSIDKYHKGYNSIKKYIKLWIIVFVLYNLIPTRNQMIIIFSADKIVSAITSKNVRAIPSKLEKILDLSIKKLEK